MQRRPNADGLSPRAARWSGQTERAIDAAARKFYRSCLSTSLPSPTFKSYVDFLIMQKLYVECRTCLPADYAFYRGKAYYYDTHVNPIKAAVAKVIVGVVMTMMKDIGPGHVPWPMARNEEE
jgi:hypothetical protein